MSPMKWFSALPLIISSVLGASEVPHARPPPGERTFTSTAIDSLVEELRPLFKSRDMATLFGNCLPNSLDTTILYHTLDPLDSFVITGDIEAMWLRDSTNQLMPYIPYSSQDVKLAALVEGLIARQARSIVIDPFANAFNYNASGEGHQSDNRKPPMGPSVFEGKYEIDSISAFLKVSYWYWKYTQSTSFMTAEWFEGVENVLNTIDVMINTDGESEDVPYLFQRLTQVSTDTLMISGRGPPAKKCRLSRSLFRPSDDAVTLPYNIPGNAMACTELMHLQTLLGEVGKANRLSESICGELSEMMDTEGDHGLPYEVDGYQSKYYMDDANIPSLLSLPVLGFVSPSNTVYKKTRAYTLSTKNPFYFKGTEGEGIGGPHVGYKYAWPMAIAMQGMTSENDAEVCGLVFLWNKFMVLLLQVQSALDLLLKSALSTGFMHESFNVDNVENYTRSWFAWANGLFGEFILQVIYERPHLLIKDEDIEKAQSLVKIPVSARAQLEPVVSA